MTSVSRLSLTNCHCDGLIVRSGGYLRLTKAKKERVRMETKGVRYTDPIACRRIRRASVARFYERLRAKEGLRTPEIVVSKQPIVSGLMVRDEIYESKYGYLSLIHI